MPSSFQKRNLGLPWRLLAIVTAIVSLIVFILTEDMRLPMVLIDAWTMLMVVLSIVQIVFLIVARVTSSQTDEEREVVYELRVGGGMGPVHLGVD